MLQAALKLATINKLAYGKGCECKNKVVKAYDGDLCEPVTFHKRSFIQGIYHIVNKYICGFSLSYSVIKLKLDTKIVAFSLKAARE